MLDRCTHRRAIRGTGRFLCSHPRVHGLGGHVVWDAICRTCRWCDHGTRKVPPKRALTSGSRGLGDTIARTLKLFGIYQSAGCGCSGRQALLNVLFPWPGDGLEELLERPLLYRFAHGLGDAVQWTVVLAHLRAAFPGLRYDHHCKRGQDTLYHGQVERTFLSDVPAAPPPDSAEYSAIHAVRWLDPDRCYLEQRHPATKAERCLVEELGITPDPALCRYQITPTDEHHSRARAYLERVSGPFERRAPVVLVHYQGNSAPRAKNIDEGAVARAIEVIRRAGLLAVLLDWETPPRSRLVGSSGLVHCAASERALWPHGVGCGGTLAALIDQSAGMLGIDSGPAHVAGSTDTPTLVVWRQHHPLHYYALSETVTHLLPAAHPRLLRGSDEERASGLEYFQRSYQHVERTGPLRRVLPEVIDSWLPTLCPC